MAYSIMPARPNRTVLVTGATGFLGRAIVRALVDAGATVIAVSRGGGPWPAAADVHAGARVVSVACELTDARAVEAVMGRHRPGAVVHAAGQVGGAHELASRQTMAALNVLGTEHVLAAAERVEVPGAVVVIGSAAQYGPLTGNRGLREDDAYHPVGLYGITKAAAARLALDFAERGRLRVVLAVPFNCIGPGQPASLVPATFIGQIIAAQRAGCRVIKVGDVSAMRDWVDVRDVADAVGRLLDTGENGTAYNICTGHPVVVADLLTRLQHVVGIAFEWTVDAARLRPGQPSVHFGNADRLARLGWRASIGLDRSLMDMWSEQR